MASNSESVLPLSLLKSNREQFNALFYEPESISLQTKTNLYIHILRVQNGDFDLAGLYRELKNNSIAYVLSRLNYSKAISDPGRMAEVVNKVQSQFRTPDQNAGEGGEVILYSFLEGHLRAPKILSKMEIKTSGQHYVHGSDGVHLFQTDDNTYQLVFGESKMYGDVGTKGSSAKRGIKAAFESIGNVHKEGFDFDTWLVESELLKEALNDDAVAALSAVLLPSARGGSDVIKKDNAFGIFVGYEIDVTDIKFEDLQLNEIETILQQRSTDAIKAEQETITEEINHHGLGVYPIHIYATPFTKRTVNGITQGIDSVRYNLAAQLGNHQASAK